MIQTHLPTLRFKFDPYGKRGEIVRQYCHAEKQWQDEKWEEDKITIHGFGNIKLKKSKKRYHYWLNYIDTACLGGNMT